MRSYTYPSCCIHPWLCLLSSSQPLFHGDLWGFGGWSMVHKCHLPSHCVRLKSCPGHVALFGHFGLSPWSWTFHCLHQCFPSRVCFCFLCKSSWRSRWSLPTSEALNVSMHPCFALVCKESVWLNSGLEIVFSQFFEDTWFLNQNCSGLISAPWYFMCDLVLVCSAPGTETLTLPSGALGFYGSEHTLCGSSLSVCSHHLFFNSVKTSWNF